MSAGIALEEYRGHCIWLIARNVRRRMRYAADVFDADCQGIDGTTWCNTKRQALQEARRIIDRLLEEQGEVVV
jgi:hypothetical protein